MTRHTATPSSSGEKPVLSLSEAVLFYKSSFGNHGYATIHDIHEDESGRPMIGAGRPLSRRRIAAWTTRLLPTLPPPRFLDDTVLAIGRESILLWYPPAHRNLLLNLTPATVENLDLKRISGKTVLSVPHPGMVVLLERSRLSAFAIDTNSRPAPSTTLFHAPLLNIYNSGEMCMGTVPLPTLSAKDISGEIGRAVFDSWSTHPNNTRATTFRGGVVKLWDEISASGRKTFPKRYLSPATIDRTSAWQGTVGERMTLQTVINAMK